MKERVPPHQPIFVGDVQGCADELEELLERCRSAYGETFDLWVVGDVVNRGPHSLRALARVRQLVEQGRCHYVLGNHELNLLRVAAGHRELSPLDSVGDVLEARDADGWIEWIRTRPLALGGRVGGQEFALVHAATHPDWSLAELLERAGRAHARLAAPDRSAAEAFLAGDPASDPDLDTLLRITACRSVAPDGSWSPQVPELAPPGFVAWHDAWGERGHSYGVVYGHWALQGLHVAPGLRGLDTGCVHHGRGRNGFLTAWVPNLTAETPFGVPDESFVQVRARRAYYTHRDSPQFLATGEEKD